MNRLKNIDQLKGFAVLLVVIGHVFVYSFGNENALLFNWLSSFHMPLFMFLAGYMAYSSSHLDIWTCIRKKAVVLLLPYLMVGGLYVSSHGNHWEGLFFGDMKSGYWFTFVLFELFCIYYMLSLLSLTINRKNQFYIDVLIFFVGYAILEVIYGFKLLPDRVLAFCAWDLLRGFYRLFVFGVFCRKYVVLNRWLHHNNLIFTIMLVISIFTFILNYIGYASYVTILLVGMSSAWCSFYLITRYSETLPFGKQLAYMGTRSLDIYVIHYFFLMSLSNLFPSDLLNNITLQVFVPLFLALMVIALSLFTSQIIRSSDWLALLLLGQRKRK